MKIFNARATHLLLLLVTVFFASCSRARAAEYVPTGPRAYVTPNANGLATTKFIDLEFWNGALASAGVGGAVATRSNPASLTTALGKVVPLPNNWAAQIPRATLAQSAAKILRTGGVYGVGAYALYELLHPLIGMNADGSISGYTLIAPGGSCSAGSYPGATYTGSSASVCASFAAWRQSADRWCNPALNSVVTVQSVSADQCNMNSYYSGANHAWSHPISSSSFAPSESDLAQEIQSSAVSDQALLEKALNDSVAKNIDFSTSGLVTPTTPMTSSAAPVSAPQETIATETINNGDGTTSTRQTKATTTATPTTTGTTAGDLATVWNVSTVYQTTTTNNTTNVTTTTSSTVYQGASDQKTNDVFTGSKPGDGFADGRAKIATVACGGNCAAALSCAAGNCTVTERINAIKAKYSVSPSASGTCPALDADLSAYHLGNHHVTQHCNIIESVRGTVSTIMTIMIALTVVGIVLSA